MTDNEIIKALECCTKGLECKNCPANPHKGNYGYCTGLLLKDTLDLINRLEAENEKLCAEIDELIIAKDLLFDEAEALIKKAKAEAYKEFAEEYKNQIKNYTGMFTDEGFMVSFEAVWSAVDFIKDKLVGEDCEKTI